MNGSITEKRMKGFKEDKIQNNSFAKGETILQLRSHNKKQFYEIARSKFQEFINVKLI